MTNHNQIEFPHFYIYDEKGTDNQNKHLSYGKMVLEGKNLIKSNHWTEPSLLFDDIGLEISKLKRNKNGLIVYIHGYQADNIFFMQKSGYTIQKEILAHTSHPYGMALSLQWSSVIPYGEAVISALIKGKQFMPLLNDIVQQLRLQHPDAPVSFICHSMGNRVFQGLYEQWLEYEGNLMLNHIFFMAADLESNIFELSFDQIEQHIRHPHVYYNRQDITLKIANAMVKNPRLGIYGTLDYTCPKNCTSRDVTEIDDDKSFAGTITNHRYFYGSLTVRNEIIKQLSIF